MNKTLLTSIFALISCFGFTQLFNTGSPELDANVSSINAQAQVDFSAFSAELSLEYGVSIKKINELHTSVKMNGGDIFLALEISKLSKKPLNDIISIYKANRDKGWGYIAKQAGIKPGSPAFHALKGNAKNKNAKGKSKGNNGKGKGNSKGKGPKK